MHSIAWKSDRLWGPAVAPGAPAWSCCYCDVWISTPILQFSLWATCIGFHSLDPFFLFMLPFCFCFFLSISLNNIFSKLLHTKDCCLSCSFDSVDALLHLGQYLAAETQVGRAMRLMSPSSSGLPIDLITSENGWKAGSLLFVMIPALASYNYPFICSVILGTEIYNGM